MKTKRSIYFLLIIIGAVIMATGDAWIQKEYALCIGIVLLMFGIYKSSQAWNDEGKDKDKEEL